MHIGIAGEVRCVITRADGTVKTDTGFQKNLILNQGLDFFGGVNGLGFNDYCLIGSGNQTPVATQTALISPVAVAALTERNTNTTYTDDGSGTYKTWQEGIYTFTGLSNVNISEVGLSSGSLTGGTSSVSNYYLNTRALIKDSLGNPTSITILSGEILNIYYRFYKVFSTVDSNYVINVTDGGGNSTPYNVKVRANSVGSVSFYGDPHKTLLAFDLSKYTCVSSQELAGISGLPTSPQQIPETLSFGAYTKGSFKIVMNQSYGVSQANGSIRTTFTYYQGAFFIPFQMRFGRVSDDAPIIKTNKETLIIPLEVSWGRYEGGL